MKTQPAVNHYTRRDFVELLALAGAGSLAAATSRSEAAQPAAATPAGAAGPTCIHVFSKPLQWMSYDTAESTSAFVREAMCYPRMSSGTCRGRLKPRARRD
jgi:hypothetical protein